MDSMRADWRPLAPTRLESLLFLALMSGPPKFRERDITASLSGAIDSTVLIQVAVWAGAGLWVLARVYPSAMKHGMIPRVDSVQVIGMLLVGALSLSLWKSPGLLLTAFMLGQFAVMLSFSWVFTHRFGVRTYLRHLFAGICVLAVVMAVAAFVAPALVFAGSEGAQRFRGDLIAPTGPVAAIGMVFCLSNIPMLRPYIFWPVLAFFGVMLATSQTRTSFIALLAYVAIGSAFGSGLRVRQLVPVLGALLLGLVLFDVLAPTKNYMVRDTESVETMSDRLPLWNHLTQAVLREEPLIGLGYFAASRVLAPEYNERLGNAHSALFEIVVGGGLLGAGLYIVLCLALLASASRVLHAGSGNPEVLAAVGLLTVALVQGITSSEGLNAGPVGFSFWSTTALLPALWRDLAMRTAPHAQERFPYASARHVPPVTTAPPVVR
jgi:hypothetical protein